MKAVIVDIDGTLADFTHRREQLWSDLAARDFTASQKASKEDPAYEWCRNLVQLYHSAGYQIIFLTARSEDYYQTTVDWLNTHLDPSIVYILLMKRAGDMRPDDIVKEELYYAEIAPNFEVEFALDDRDSVVAMWRDRVGIPCLQVQKGQY